MRQTSRSLFIPRALSEASRHHLSKTQSHLLKLVAGRQLTATSARTLPTPHKHVLDHHFILCVRHFTAAISNMSRTISLYSPSMKAALDSSDPDDTLESIITTWTNDMLEARHDYIQHLFPLPERSPINPNAPLITKDVRDAFLKHKDLSTQLGRAFARMAAFYGFVVWDNVSHDFVPSR